MPTEFLILLDLCRTGIMIGFANVSLLLYAIYVDSRTFISIET